MRTNTEFLNISAVGYGGGRRMPLLLECGGSFRSLLSFPLHQLARDPDPHPAMETVAGDAFDRTPFILSEAANEVILKLVRQEQVDPCFFSGGGQLPPQDSICADADRAGGGVMRRGYRIEFEGDALNVWSAIEAIGGGNGWYFAQPLWRLRGILDRMAGGPGLMRGRRHPQKLRTGDTLDFWRVAAHEPPRRLLLLSEMKAPGDALLEFCIHPHSDRRVRLEMVSHFSPQGLAGLAYWYGMLPIHDWLFKGILARIAGKCGSKRMGRPEIFPIEIEVECK